MSFKVAFPSKESQEFISQKCMEVFTHILERNTKDFKRSCGELKSTILGSINRGEFSMAIVLTELLDSLIWIGGQSRDFLTLLLAARLEQELMRDAKGKEFIDSLGKLTNFHKPR